VPPKSAVLITGTAKGIGRDLTISLAKMGVVVFAGVRNEKDGEELKAQNQNIHPVILDITNEKHVRDAFQTVNAKLNDDDLHLISVINNAGYGEPAPMELIPIHKLQRQFDVNVFGQMRVTQTFLPLLRKHNNLGFNPRLLFVGSMVGRLSYPFSGSYCASKYALEAIADSLRVELKPWNIHVALIEPGKIDTPFFETSLQLEQQTLEELKSSKHKLELSTEDWTLYEKSFQAFITWARTTPGAHVSEVTKQIKAALFDSSPLPRYLVGLDAHLLIPLSVILPECIADYFLDPYRNKLIF